VGTDPRTARLVPPPAPKDDGNKIFFTILTAACAVSGVLLRRRPYR
jgi:hypothetical protein